VSGDQDSLELQAQLYQKLVGNPKTREATLRMVKHVSPGLMIPEIDAKDAVMAKVGELEAKIAERDEADARRQVINTLEEQKKQLLTRPGWVEADVKATEQLMIEKGIANYATAADFLDLQRQSALPTPTPETTQPFQLGLTSEDLKNPEAWSRKVAHEAINELNTARRNGVTLN